MVKRAVLSDIECSHCDRKFTSRTAYKLHLIVTHPGKKDTRDTSGPIKRRCASCKKPLPNFARRCDKGCT